MIVRTFVCDVCGRRWSEAPDVATRWGWRRVLFDATITPTLRPLEDDRAGEKCLCGVCLIALGRQAPEAR